MTYGEYARQLIREVDQAWLPRIAALADEDQVKFYASVFRGLRAGGLDHQAALSVSVNLMQLVGGHKRGLADPYRAWGGE